MIAVASAGPPNPAPPGTAPPAAAAAPGGVFAALFGETALCLDPAPEAAPATGSTAANILGLLQGALAPGANPSPAGTADASGTGADGEQPDGKSEPDGGEFPAVTATLPLATPTTGLPSAEQPQPPEAAAVESTAAPPPPLATKAPEPNAATPAAEPPQSPGPVPASMPSAAPPPPAPVSAASTAAKEDFAPAPAAIAPKVPSPPRLRPDLPAAATDGAMPPDTAEDLPEGPGPAHALTGPKKATASASRPAAASAKAATENTGNAPSPPAHGVTNIAAATATHETSVLPLTPGPEIPVKTVPVSNLAGLAQQAAVTAIGAAIAAEASRGTNRFIIRLDPPDLGRIDVRLRFDRDGELRAHLVADRPDTVGLLTRDAAALERTLNASGIRTSDTGIDVSLRDPSGGLAQNGGTFSGEAQSLYTGPVQPSGTDAPAPNTFIWVRPHAAAGRLDVTV